jgi:hypothetical protein
LFSISSSGREIQAIVIHDLIVSANVSYAHAALVSAQLVDSGFNPGTPIQDVPHWTSSASIAYRHSLTDQLAFTARADNTYVGGRTDETFSVNTLPSYDLTNVRGGVEAVVSQPRTFGILELSLRTLVTGRCADQQRHIAQLDVAGLRRKNSRAESRLVHA